MSFFVDPTRESNMQGRYLPRFSLLHRVSTTVTLYIDGIFLEVEQVARSRKWMLEARVTLNCGSDESTSRILSLTNHLIYLPLPLLIFKLEYVYLIIWCSASLIVRNGASQVGQYVIGNAAEVSLKLSGVAGDESGCYRAAVFKAVSFFRK